ncbi:MAG: tRNA (guanosine(37)-N1)-methyltransferase TrmD, partial [Candidatus Azambacteria bacterium]|nr:tRNA (guanosine(37)-N1)-methyltransferase TrmD [Candidatus Azambacteria bacterium]
MQFDIITIFPKIFDSYFKESIIKRAQKKRKIKINIINLRDFTNDKHRTVDEKPYGGGAGMVLMAEPVIKAVDYVKKSGKNKKIKIVVLSAKGKQFNQKTAYNWAKKYDQIIFVSGRYEGIDERVKTILK